MYGCRKTNQNLAKICLCARSLEMQHVETVQVFTELTPWYDAFSLVWFSDNSGSFHVIRQYYSEWSVGHFGLICLSSWHCDRIQFLWHEFFKAVLSAVFTKDTFIPINHRLMLNQYISPVAEALMNEVCLIWILFIPRWQLSFHQTVAMISWTWLTSGVCLIDTARLWLMPWRTTYPCAVGLFGSYFSSLLSPLRSQFYKTTRFSHEFFIT
jgi:hypothetical protein